MNTIVNEKLISFKELEIKIFDYICELGREMTQIMLERYDVELREGRNKKEYRCKGTRNTTIKTVYGEVEYSRNIYQTVTDDGKKAFIYLLDEALAMDKIGMISTNLAEKIADTVTEAPYRATAEMISSTCGQSISHGGVWNLIQKLGDRISEEEKADFIDAHRPGGGGSPQFGQRGDAVKAGSYRAVGTEDDANRERRAGAGRLPGGGFFDGRGDCERTTDSAGYSRYPQEETMSEDRM